VPGAVPLEIGVYLPQVGLSWDEVRSRARACDQLGIDSLWFMDHLYPPGQPALGSFEAWTTASALASVTERIRLGHLVLAAGLRHPALLAKMATTLDHASGGRLNVGLGTGSYPPEFADLGLDFPAAGERAARLGEALEVLRLLWTEDAPSFSGRHYRLRAAPSLPRPVQQPHPPLVLGGAGETLLLPLAARHAQVWNCPTYALAELPRKVARLRAECARIGRDPASLRVTEEAVLALVPRRDQVEAARATAERRFGGPGWGVAAGGYCGTPDDVVARLGERARQGVQGVVFFLHDRGHPETLRLLATEVLPAARQCGIA
jgi:alkanesulfonate monooxygenase SsuD/methylene tetrahydromethanopterin reductase-like flavin-dependent oxidoreductase (luciferase family)